MDNGSSKKVAGTIFVVVLLLVGVLVGTLITRNVSDSQNTTTSASQATVTPLEVISPVPSQQITKITEVKAMVANTSDISQLTAVYKIGETTAMPMKITQQGGKVILTGSLDPSQAAKGRNTLSIYLYQSTSGQTELIGSSVFYIQI